MPNDSKNNYLKWFEKANDDELNARSILTHRDGAPSGVCFLSQQTTEKYLKALLVFHDKKFPKVHDLLKLETLLMDFEPDINNIHQNLVLLNRYYIETRYPGDYLEFSWKEAKKALEAATQIKKFVLEKTENT